MPPRLRYHRHMQCYFSNSRRRRSHSFNSNAFYLVGSSLGFLSSFGLASFLNISPQTRISTLSPTNPLSLSWVLARWHTDTVGCPQLKDLYTLDDEILGEGSFGVVRKGTNKVSGERVAIKIMNKSETSAKNFWAEVDVLRIIGKHPNIMSTKGIYETDEAWYIVQDLATGGELFDRLVQTGAYSEKEASLTLRDLCDALRHLHSKGIIHGDVKPENILLHKDRMYLVDFGVSFRVGEQSDHYSGTTAYSAPETLALDRKEHGPEADMFAFGIVMYILLVGSHPFDRYNCITDDQLRENICKGNYQLDKEQLKNLSPLAKDLLWKLLHPNPKERISSSEALKHPWFSEDTPLYTHPLVDVNDRLARFQRGRRRLRASILAVLIAKTCDEHPKNLTLKEKKKYKDQLAFGISSNSDFTESKIATVMSALRILDRDNKGYISKEDMKRVTSELGIDLNEEQLNEMVAAADGDPDLTSQEILYDDVKMTVCSLKSKVFQKGEVIIKEGEKTDRVFYLLIDGEVEASCKNPMKHQQKSSRVMLRRLHKGNYFGEIELLGPEGMLHPRIASYQCISSSCKVLTLTARDFATLKDQYKQVDREITEKAYLTTNQQLVKCVEHAKENIQRLDYPKGAIVVEENEDLDSFYVIMKGKVKVIQEDGALVETLGVGDYFPISGLPGHRSPDEPDDEKTKRSVVCVEPTQIVEISGDTFRSFVNSSQFLVAFFQEQAVFDKMEYFDEWNTLMNGIL